MSPSATAHSARGGAPARYAIVAVIFLALGVGAAAAFNALSSGAQTAAPAPAEPAGPPVSQEPVAAAVASEEIAAPEGPADRPATAVAQFLAAEQRRDYEGSYDLLTPASREAFGTSAQWVAAHADLPKITGWEQEAVQGDDATAQVVGTVGFRASLDEVAGLIPGSASATWQVLSDDGLWFVDYDASDLLPRYPGDETAAEAVHEWVAAAQRCEAGPQYDGGLLGRPALAAELCDVTGEPDVGPARALETPELDVLLPPFGSDAEVWGRAVDVAGPVPLRALVAPLGQEWIVVAVLEPA